MLLWGMPKGQDSGCLCVDVKKNWENVAQAASCRKLLSYIMLEWNSGFISKIKSEMLSEDSASYDDKLQQLVFTTKEKFNVFRCN